MGIRIRVQGVKNLRIRIQVLIFTKNLCLFKTIKQKKNFVSGSKCGSGSRDSKNADPVRIRIRDLAFFKIKNNRVHLILTIKWNLKNYKKKIKALLPVK